MWRPPATLWKTGDVEGPGVTGRPSAGEGPSTGEDPSGGRDRRSRRAVRAAARAWAPAIPAAATLAVMLWRIQGPSFWRDEAATLSAAHRTLPELLRMLGHVDAVHGAYYLLMWAVVRLAGSGELAVRFPSALAMAAAAGTITALGRRLVSLPAGLASGLVFAVLPAVSWFGQDARPFAIETGLACATSYLFVRAWSAPAGRERGHWLGRYALSLAVLGVVDVFGLLLAGAHALTLVLSRGGGHDRGLVRGWLAAVGAAGVAMTPFALLDWTERGQIDWLTWPGLSGVLTVGRLVGPHTLDLSVVAITGCGITVSALAGRIRLDWPARLPALCLPWLLLPAAVLLAASWLVRPVYAFRYIVFCMPAAALLGGAALAAVAAAARVAGGAALVMITLLSLPSQVAERGPTGHGDGIRQLDQVLARDERPGDGVLYLGGPGMRTFAAAYPFGLARLRDVALGESPDRSGTLSGTDVPLVTVRARLSRISRVWVVEPNGPPVPLPVQALQGMAFRLVRTWHVTDIWLRLYAQAPSAPDH